MKKLFAVIVIASIVAASYSTGTHMGVFNKKYHPKAGSELAKALCLTCHTSMKGKTLNPYGKDLQTAMKAANSKKLTNEILASVEGKDSTKSGETNIVKINAGKNPGK